MPDYRDATDSSDGSTRRQHLLHAPHPGFAQLKDYPELKEVLTQAVDEVITSSNINRGRDAILIEGVERAVAAAALTTYQKLAVSAEQTSDADHARRAQAHSAATTGEVIAEQVTDAAAALHDVQEASAAQVASVAADAASELAASVGEGDETAASGAAALVVTAVSDAAAIRASARATAASLAAHAAADAAAHAAEEAVSTASAAEVDAITDASDRQQDALQTCYQVATATTQALLSHYPGPSLPRPAGCDPAPTS
ncbi:MAG TPA: hypothetical protein VF635_04620 [Propionibacteriaceae bacterium]|jgi:hypothetical protein